MRKLPLNLASAKTINNRIFVPLVAALLCVSLFLTWAGIYSIKQYSRRSEAQKEQSQWQKQRATDLAEKQRGLENLVNQKKSIWQTRIHFFNRLIDKKSYSFCSNLDFLEKIMPPEVYLEKLTIGNGQNRLPFTLTAPSYAQLIETYRKLSAYGMNITSEYEKDGMWHVILSVRCTDEKK